MNPFGDHHLAAKVLGSKAIVRRKFTKTIRSYLRGGQFSVSEIRCYVLSDLGYLGLDWWHIAIPTHSRKQVADMSIEETPEESPEPLRLDHFLKTMGMSETGGQAKLRIQNGEVKVNGAVETRRRRKLQPADVVELGGKKFVVTVKP